MSLSTAKRFTIAEYHRLAELGFFKEGDYCSLDGSDRLGYWHQFHYSTINTISKYNR